MVATRRRCDWLALWILVSAWCSLTGWALSAFGQLDRAGYAFAFLVLAGGVLLGRKELGLPATRPVFLLRLSTYRGSWLPRLWLALAVLSFIGGLLYHPDDFDYLTYRFPRLLHWSWAHHWYWIHTINERLNLSAPGFEWLMAPLFILFHTDRLFFLINVLSYLFLPGLVFSVFGRLGIQRRVAWWWMWTLPAGFCYVSSRRAGRGTTCSPPSISSPRSTTRFERGRIPSARSCFPSSASPC